MFEVNFDGLVGPTHNYAGLASGNLASQNNALSRSNPRAAALQGVEKMRFVSSGLGLIQGLIPPHQRPNLSLLTQLGFTGTVEQQLRKAYQVAPEILSACYSASSMWTANAATVTPSIDAADGRVHFTAANLMSNLHRHQEAEFSRRLLQKIFAHEQHFTHHSILPSTVVTSDEGAANHSRLCKQHQDPGIHLFVYGKKAFNEQNIPTPRVYQARQTYEASQALARKHQLSPEQTVFACQNPEAIDAGVFHNDVIAVANESVLLIHEQAFLNQHAVLHELRQKMHAPLQLVEIPIQDLSLNEAVSSYLFNSQLLSLPNSSEMLLLAPSECAEQKRVKTCIDKIISSATNPITQVHYLDLRQSMRNGGGPACLRLRVLMSQKASEARHQNVLGNNELINRLTRWNKKHYREEMMPSDLLDPQLVQESYSALDELTQILNLGSIYPFQKYSHE